MLLLLHQALRTAAVFLVKILCWNNVKQKQTALQDVM